MRFSKPIIHREDWVATVPLSYLHGIFTRRPHFIYCCEIFRKNRNRLECNCADATSGKVEWQASFVDLYFVGGDVSGAFRTTLYCTLHSCLQRSDVMSSSPCCVNMLPCGCVPWPSVTYPFCCIYFDWMFYPICVIRVPCRPAKTICLTISSINMLSGKCCRLVQARSIAHKERGQD